MTAATIPVLADLMGISAHGVARVPSYGGGWLRIGGIKAAAEMVTEQLAPGRWWFEARTRIAVVFGDTFFIQ